MNDIKTKTPYRVAIYTRKSTTENLDKEFTSLDQQRQSCELTIQSRSTEGWTVYPETYDDGGFSGGNTKRPALQRLLQDARDRKFDCVMVYKIDRLSRSLVDFYGILEELSKLEVHFQSVTQNFDTRDSMGRLVLNILVTFAQFEREQISDRISDKIRAARRLGKFTGGTPPLGYDIHPDGGKLVVSPKEAELVQKLFRLYTVHRSLGVVSHIAGENQWKTKRWTTRAGAVTGGRTLTRKELSKILKNPIYIGKVRLGQDLYEGEHDAVVETDTFQKVQDILAANKNYGNKPRVRCQAPLKGLLFCSRGSCPMGSTYSVKNKTKKYHYYGCLQARNQGCDCQTKNLPAGTIEEYVLSKVRRIGKDASLLGNVWEEAKKAKARQIEENRQILGKAQDHKRQMEQEMNRIISRDDLEERERFQLLSDAREQLNQIGRKITTLNEEHNGLKKKSTRKADFRKALTQFDGIWDALPAPEKNRLLRLLIQRIDFDPNSHEIQMGFRYEDLHRMVVENSNEGGS